VLHFTALQCTALLCTVAFNKSFLNLLCSALHCTALLRSQVPTPRNVPASASSNKLSAEMAELHRLVTALLIRVVNQMVEHYTQSQTQRQGGSAGTSLRPMLFSEDTVGNLVTPLPGLLSSCNVNVQTAAKHLLSEVLSSGIIGRKDTALSSSKAGRGTTEKLSETNLDYSLSLPSLFSLRMLSSSTITCNSISPSSTSVTESHWIHVILKALLKGLKHILSYLKVTQLLSIKYNTTRAMITLLGDVDSVFEVVLKAVYGQFNSEISVVNADSSKEIVQQQQVHQQRKNVMFKRVDEVCRAMLALNRNSETGLSLALKGSLSLAGQVEGLGSCRALLDSSCQDIREDLILSGNGGKGRGGRGEVESGVNRGSSGGQSGIDDEVVILSTVTASSRKRSIENAMDSSTTTNGVRVGARDGGRMETWEALAWGSKQGQAQQGQGQGPQGQYGQGRAPQSADSSSRPSVKGKDLVVTTSSSSLYPTATYSKHVQDQRAYEQQQPLMRQRELQNQQERYLQYQQQEKLQADQHRQEKEKKLNSQLQAEQRQRQGMAQFLNISPNSNTVQGTGNRAQSHWGVAGNTGSNSTKNANGWAGYWTQMEKEEEVQESFNKKRKGNVRDILDKRDSEASNGFYQGFSGDNALGGYGNHNRGKGRDTGVSDFWTEQREQEWVEGGQWGKREKINGGEQGRTGSGSGSGTGYVGYSGHGWNTQMQELKEKKLAARLLHQTAAGLPETTATSGVAGESARRRVKASEGGGRGGHDRFHCEGTESTVYDPNGLDEGFDPQYLRGLSGVEGEASTVQVRAVSGVFDVDQFIATAVSKKKKGGQDASLAVLDTDGKVVVDREKEKKQMENKKIHDGLLQRLRAAAEYRENSSTQLSAKAISESLESVSIDSLLGQVLRFNLSQLSALAHTSNPQNPGPGSSKDSEELIQVPYRFLHEEQYIEYFHPLLIEEVKASLETNILGDGQNHGNRRGGRSDKNFTVHCLKVMSVAERAQRGSVSVGTGVSGSGDLLSPSGDDKKKKRAPPLLEIRVAKASYRDAEAHMYPKDSSDAASNTTSNGGKAPKVASEAPKYPSSSSFSVSSVSSAYMDFQKDDLVLILKKKSFVPIGNSLSLYLSLSLIFFISASISIFHFYLQPPVQLFSALTTPLFLLCRISDAYSVKDLLLLPHTLAVVIAVPRSKKNEASSNNNHNNNNNNSSGGGDHLTLLSLSVTAVQEDSVFLCVSVMSLSTFARSAPLLPSFSFFFHCCAHSSMGHFSSPTN
jgi:hypothetical protein